jgi:hypothetical protein
MGNKSNLKTLRSLSISLLLSQLHMKYDDDSQVMENA